MKKIIILLAILILVSCQKIEPETQELAEDEYSFGEYYGIKDACGVTSCFLKDTLSEKEFLGELNLPDLDFYQNWLNNLLVVNDSKDKLIKNEEFIKFVNTLNEDFFGCNDNVYKCVGTNKYGKDESDYLFYMFIPQLVIKATENKNWSGDEQEALIQAIKRKDFKSRLEKDLILQEYKENLETKINNLNFDLIDKEKLKTDINYFYEIILKPGSGLHDYIIINIPSIKIDWEEEGQMEEIVEFTTNLFFEKLELLGFTKEEFIEKINEINSYDSNIDIITNIVNDIEKSSEIFKEKNLGFPKHKYFRNDELYIFENANEYTSEENKELLLELRHKVLLLFNLGKEQELYSIIERLKLYDVGEKFLIENVFKYSKYLKVENEINF